MKLKIAVTPSSFAEADTTPLAMLTSAGVEVAVNPLKRRLSEDEAIEQLRDADGVVAGLEPLTRRVFQNCPKLKAIARVGAGVDNVDFAAAKEFGIKVSNTPDGPTEAVAEMTLAAALTLLRGVVPANEALHRKEWKKQIGQSLFGATVFLIGFGRIGRQFAELLAPFRVKLLVHDPAIDGSKIAKAGLSQDFEIVGLHDGLSRADLVSLHASGKNQILGKDEVSRMKRGSILLNGARGELVDESAVVTALETGILAGAWFDTFVQEPYSGALCSHDKVLLSPHVANYTARCRLKMESDAVSNLLRDLGS